MLVDIIFLIVGLTTLTIGAEGLVRGSASLSIRFGLTPLIIGLTVVAFGTSTPELVVSVMAAMSNQPDISIGNIVGSNIFNIGIILGITALICPIKTSLQVIKLDGPIMIFVSLILLLLVTMGTISRMVGIMLFLSLLAYVAFTIWITKKDQTSVVESQFGDGVPSQSRSLYMDLIFIGGGLLLLVVGSRLFVASATDMALIFGISEAVIGLTVVAAGTSLPELATSMVAAIRHQPDIAVGNVVGSNIFNILGILGVASIVNPIRASGITPLDLGAMLIFSIALLPFLYTDLKLQRWEGGLLLLGYGLYIGLLWP